MATFIMLKTFLAALTTSTLSFLLLYHLLPHKAQQLEHLRLSMCRRDHRGLLFVSSRRCTTRFLVWFFTQFTRF